MSYCLTQGHRLWSFYPFSLDSDAQRQTTASIYVQVRSARGNTSVKLMVTYPKMIAHFYIYVVQLSFRLSSEVRRSGTSRSTLGHP